MRLRSVSDAPEREAQMIMEQVYGRDFRLELIKGRLDREPSPVELAKVEDIVSRRISGEPLQYIFGEWEFYGLSFRVTPDVLIPRPDTETLVDTALNLLDGITAPKVLDLCSGTGCVALAIKSVRPDAEVSALELSAGAYEVMKENIARHGGVTPINADALASETVRGFQELDLITANPPYLTAEEMEELQPEVRSEPKMALYGGPDGLDFYRTLSNIWRPALKEGGRIAFEIGFRQSEDVCGILRRSGWRDIAVNVDIEGRPRVVYATK